MQIILDSINYLLFILVSCSQTSHVGLKFQHRTLFINQMAVKKKKKVLYEMQWAKSMPCHKMDTFCGGKHLETALTVSTALEFLST